MSVKLLVKDFPHSLQAKGLSPLCTRWCRMSTKLLVRVPTLTPIIRPFSCVNSPVYNEVKFSSKRYPTLSTLITPFSSMNCPFSNYDGSAAQRLCTFTAQVTMFSNVTPPRINKDKVLVKEFPTSVALLLPCPSMNSSMQIEG